MESDLCRLVFEVCPEPLLVVRDGRVAKSNAGSRRMLGARSADEVEGRRIEEIIPMDLDNRTGLHSTFMRILPGDTRSFEWELSLPGGAYVPVVIKATGLAGGMLLLSFADCTESRERTRALFEVEEQRRALLEACQDPCLLVDRDFRIVWCNAAAGRIAGEPGSALPGRICYRMLSSRDSFCPGCPAAISFRSKKPVTSSVWLGECRWVSSSAPVRAPDGSVSGTVICLRSGTREGDPAAPAPVVVHPPELAGVAEPSPSYGADAPGEGLLDLAHWVSESGSALRSVLGDSVSVLSTYAPARVRAAEDQILDTVRRIAEADFGACLDSSGGLVVRIDSARLDSPAGEIRPGEYVSMSIGSRAVLEGVDSGLFGRAFYNYLSPFPMGTGGRKGSGTGAVFVSVTGDRRKFYQIVMAEEAVRGGGEQ